MRKPFLRLIALTIALLFSIPLFASNGMNLIGYGARYAGMGGAVLAVGGSVMDLQSNPANLTRLKESRFEVGTGVLIPYTTYRDSYYGQATELDYANSVKSEPNAFPLPYLGYASPVGDNQGWGIAFYAQGGAGAEFNGMQRQTPGLPVNPPYSFAPGTIDQVMQSQTGNPNATVPYIGHLRQLRENTYSNFGFARLTPGYAIRFGKLSLGAGVDFGVALLEWRWTFSDPTGLMEMPGAGYRYKSDPGYSLGGKVGATYELTDTITVAYAYKSKAKMYLNGDMSINAGNPNYFKKLDVSMYMEWPEAHRAGIAYSKDGLTLSFDAEYVKWSNVMNTVEFTLPAPWVTTPIGNMISTMAFNLKWKDQTIVATGIEYKKGSFAYRAGYNYGRNPVSEQGINPLFPAITEHHASVGLGYDSGTFELDFALVYAFPSKVNGSDTSDWDMFHAMYGLSLDGFQNPYYNHSVEMHQVTPHIGFTYKFG